MESRIDQFVEHQLDADRQNDEGGRQSDESLSEGLLCRNRRLAGIRLRVAVAYQLGEYGESNHANGWYDDLMADLERRQKDIQPAPHPAQENSLSVIGFTEMGPPRLGSDERYSSHRLPFPIARNEATKRSASRRSVRITCPSE